MSPLAGVAMSFGLVAVLILPFRFGGGGLLGPAASPVIDRSAVTLADRQIEANYIAMVRQGSLPSAAERSVPAATSHQQNYPDNYRPQRKEVGPAEPTGRPPEAI
jgi:hypothetical protein